VDDFKPFFYLKVDANWGQTKKTALLAHLKNTIGRYYEDGITSCKLIKRKKLYGFDNGAQHLFVEIKFANLTVYNKVKNLWYYDSTNEEGEKERRLLEKGYSFFHNGQETHVELYEANIPPLLRFFHIREVSPSGWVRLPKEHTTLLFRKTTTCDVELVISHQHIIALNDKEDKVPFKIMSFDIEASSSHGDFPVPIKSYKKLANNIVDHFAKLPQEVTKPECNAILRQIVSSAFGFTSGMSDIDLVYPKTPLVDLADLQKRTEMFLKTKVKELKNETPEENIIEMMFENANKILQQQEKEENDDDDDDTKNKNKKNKGEGDSDDDNDNDNDNDDDDDDNNKQILDEVEQPHPWNKQAFSSAKTSNSRYPTFCATKNSPGREKSMSSCEYCETPFRHWRATW
jgi:hypothetical protein